MREVRDRLVAHLPALTPRAAQQMRLVVPRRTVLTHIVTTVCSHVYGPTTFSHTTKLPDRHIDSVTISDDTPDASDTTSPQVTQRINPQRARNFGLGRAPCVFHCTLGPARAWPVTANAGRFLSQRRRTPSAGGVLLPTVVVVVLGRVSVLGRVWRVG